MEGRFTFLLKPVLSVANGILVDAWNITSVVELQ